MDLERNDVRADCAAADMSLVTLILCLGTCLGSTFGCADIKAALMQSGPITRKVYVRPPRDCQHEKGEIWKLLKIPYGMCDAGRQWILKIEDWMIKQYRLERVFGAPSFS